MCLASFGPVLLVATFHASTRSSLRLVLVSRVGGILVVADLAVAVVDELVVAE
jgi:hypothetical protein